MRRKPSRLERRVLLALLSGASNLSSYPLSRAAQVRSGRALIIVGRLERAGLVEARSDGNGRRFYRLTDEGRTHALSALGLQEDCQPDPDLKENER